VAQDKNRPEREPAEETRSKRLLRAAILSAGIVALVAMYLSWRSNFCRLYLLGPVGASLGPTFLWIYLFAFFALRFRGRVVMITCTALVYFTRPNIDSISPVVMAQVEAVGALRGRTADLRASKNQHPELGYPRSIPEVSTRHHAEKFYRFKYVPIEPASDGQFRSYLLTATPTRRACGCAMSLATSDDGVLHVTEKDGAPTLGDITMDEWSAQLHSPTNPPQK
jgi:hypothetical protein